MSHIITVIIQPDGRNCMEVGKIKKPDRSKMGGLKYINKCEKYFKQQSKLRTFEIEPCEHCGGDNVYIDGDNNRLECPLHFTFKPGSQHQAQIINETKVRIL